ncbi:MAG: DDE-type integrase/transposase/recombinase [Nanoarchaeota archaeon]
MGRLTPEKRALVSKLKRQGIAIKIIVEMFSCSRQTVWFWSIQDLRTRFNIIRNYKSKITIEAEITILFLRSLGYGCARIKQRLLKAPEIELKLTEIYVQGLEVSRQAVYKFLKKHKLNGYNNKRNQKAWKFFRADCSNQLWQLDLKEFKFEGKKYYFIVCIDDYSRNLLCLKLLDHCPTTNEITSALQKLNIKPKVILTDNGGQFKEQWKLWCKEQGIEAKFAHPYYPQDKGKVERTNRNIAEELINLVMKFHKMLNREEIES